MLIINLPGVEAFNETTLEFVNIGAVTLELEHSLVSVSKWESIHEKAFLDNADKTPEESLSYIRCMILDPDKQNVDLSSINSEISKRISDYINAKTSATTIKETHKAGPKTSEFVTSELIYYWMSALQLPINAESWHLNRLLTLVKVANAKNQPPKKMDKRSAMNQHRSLNAQRRAMYGG